MPDTVEPDETNAEIWCAPPPLSPLTWAAAQADPVAEVQIWTLCWPGESDWLAAVKPPELAVSAVTATPGPAEPNGFSCQLAPPSEDNSANGTDRPAFVAWPRATTWSPLIATCVSAAAEAPGGRPRRIVVQSWPSVVVHTAGWPPSEPTAMNSCASAPIASTWPAPSVSFMLVSRVQEVRFGDHHSSAVPPLPEAARLAAMTYPDGF